VLLACAWSHDAAPRARRGKTVGAPPVVRAVEIQGCGRGSDAVAQEGIGAMNGIDHNESNVRWRVALRSRAATKLVGALAAASLMIPAAASGYAVPGNVTGSGPAATDNTGAPVNLRFPSTATLAQHQGGSTAAPVNLRFPSTATLAQHQGGSTAEPFVANVSTPKAAAGDGFDWGAVLAGAGAALGIVALAGAGLTFRRHGAARTA